MRKIDIHTHIMPKQMPNWMEKFGYGGFIKLEHLDSCSANMLRDDGKFFRKIESNCWDPQVRMDECDKAGVQLQVLSTIPVLFSYWAKAQDGIQIAQFLNDHIAGIVRTFPHRFAGLGTLPMQDPDLACQELHRVMVDLRLSGVELGTHLNDKNLNHPDFQQVFAEAEKLGAAIFVHPWDMMGMDTMPDYWLPWLVGMPAETSRAICSMIFGGVFDKFPKLKVAFAHGGGSFPCTIGRIEHGHKVRPDLCAVDNPQNPRNYLGRFFVDSLVHDPLALAHNIELFGKDKICLGSDYPFPLGEHLPGDILNNSNFDQDTAKKIVFDNPCTWLGIDPQQL